MRRKRLLQAIARQRIERAERLVEQHHARLGGERAGDADALLLAARELVRPARRGSPPGSSSTSSSSSSTRRRMRASSQPSSDGVTRDVLGDGQVREEADALEDVADAAAQLVRRQARARRRRRCSTRPDVGSMRRLIILSVVVLPQPEPPSRTSSSPSSHREAQLRDGDDVAVALLSRSSSIIGKPEASARAREAETSAGEGGSPLDLLASLNAAWGDLRRRRRAGRLLPGPLPELARRSRARTASSSPRSDFARTFGRTSREIIAQFWGDDVDRGRAAARSTTARKRSTATSCGGASRRWRARSS